MLAVVFLVYPTWVRTFFLLSAVYRKCIGKAKMRTESVLIDRKQVLRFRGRKEDVLVPRVRAGK